MPKIDYVMHKKSAVMVNGSRYTIDSGTLGVVLFHSIPYQVLVE